MASTTTQQSIDPSHNRLKRDPEEDAALFAFLSYKRASDRDSGSGAIPYPLRRYDEGERSAVD
jgi:hypothetical protein